MSWDEEVAGAVLRHRNVVRLAHLQSGKVSVKTETMEVTELEHLEPSDIPENTFSMPKCEPIDQADVERRAWRFFRNAPK